MQQTEMFNGKDFYRPVKALLSDLFNSKKLSPEEDAIARLLVAQWGEKAMTQRQIAKSQPWLGCHPEHEKDVVRNEFETTCRRVRAIIRSLRVNHKCPILSDREGYWLPNNEQESVEYLQRSERTVRARIKASNETYSAMKSTLGITSEFFDALT